MSMRARRSGDKPTKQKVAEALAAASRRRRQAQQQQSQLPGQPPAIPEEPPAGTTGTTGTATTGTTNTTPTGTTNTPTGTTTATTTTAATTTDAKQRLRDRVQAKSSVAPINSLRTKKSTGSGRKRGSKKGSRKQESSAGADVKDSERGDEKGPFAVDSPANLKLINASLRTRKKKSKDRKDKHKKGHTDGSEKKLLRDTPSKRNPKSPGTKSLMQVATPKNDDEMAASSELHKDDEAVGDKKSNFEARNTLAADGRAAFAKTVYTKKLRGIVKEFTKSRDYLPPTSATAYTANENKNRYGDVLCMDETRVVLKGRRPDNDYIHASWLVCPVPGSQKYICAQGPLDDTVVDFWQMVFQERVPVIVMLCGIIENGYEKCAQYWPPAVGDTVRHGKFLIKNERSELTEMESIRITTLTVENLDFRKAHDRAEADLTVSHYHWGDWPDHVSPLDPSPAIELLKWTKEKANGAPIVVHCSAGIGRTGTFCGIDYANDKLRTSTALKMTEIVHEMRRQRVHSIQSNPQYAYVHICLLHLFIEQKVITETEETKTFYHDYRRYVELVKRNVEKNMRKKERFAAEKERDRLAEKEKDKAAVGDKEKVAEKESDRERPQGPES
uniref:Protein-tyrosine-phosphatase n=1 Tax=Panagrellus redivivus TaxID=6233 RepID=A0A7E4VBU4_PANRE